MTNKELSEYEQQRQANIAERDALLKKLSLDAASAGLGPRKTPQSRSNGSSSHKKKKPVSKAPERVLPTRTSSRLKGIEADSEKAKRKAEEEYAAVREAERKKRQRVSKKLNLGEIVITGKSWDSGDNVLLELIDRNAKPHQRTFSDDAVKQTTNKELKALREKMSGLELFEEFEPSRIKITPERIYSIGFHPDEAKALVFAGDKMGNLGIFDASNPSTAPKDSDKIKKSESDDEEEEEEAEPAITSFHLHTRTISTIECSPSEPSKLVTSSYDSSIRELDLVKSTSTEVYGPSDVDTDEPISTMQIDPLNPKILYFSRLDGFVGRHDLRSKATDVWQLSEKKVGGFSVHPQYPHYLATASLDRTVKLWDLRKITSSHGEKTPALLGEHESRLSVSHADFNAVGQFVTSSYDDTCKIYSFEGMADWKEGKALKEELMTPSYVVPHNNQTGRWVTILRPKWQKSPSDSVQRFVIGNMNRFVDVYAGTGEQLAQLGGEGITAVPAVAEFHPSKDWIAAGTASGKLCLWM